MLNLAGWVLLSVIGQVDGDGDGVLDAADAYPCDPAAAAQAFAPALGEHGSISFEDRWPARGDLDFNDVVLAWSVVLRLDAAGNAVAAQLDLDPIALGGSYDLGLGLRMPVPADALLTASRSIELGAPQPLSATDDDQLTVQVSSNLRELFSGTAGPINSTAGAVRRSGARLRVSVAFSRPVAISTADAPFDLFIFRSDRPDHQIHRPEHDGTKSMNRALFGSMDDGSTATRRFVDRSGLPFALLLPEAALYPAENVEISRLFPRIADFASSGGTLALDFYTRDVATAAAYTDANGAGPLTPRFAGDHVPDACNECTSGHCLAASCTDGVQNGTETVVDCGGSCIIAETCNGIDDDCDGLVDEGVCSVVDEMTSSSGLWTPEISYGAGSFGPSYSAGHMVIASPNNAVVRMRSASALAGDFEVRVSGRAYWNGSYTDTHIKPFVGLYHAGATSLTAHQLRGFFSNVGQFWGGDTHYAIDVNALLGTASGATRAFNLRFSKIGSTVRIYSVSGTTETLRSTLTIQNPAASLFFELVHVDGTSSGNGNLQIDRYELTRIH